MNKILPVLFVAMSSLSLMNEKEETYTYDAPRTVQGAQYGVYEDEQCKKPILDENEEEVVINVDLNEEQTYTSSLEHVYIQQTKTVKGYFLDETIYDLSKENVYSVYPIKIKYEISDYPIKLQLFHNGDLIEKWDSTNKDTENQILYEAGETYTMHPVIDEEYVYCPDKTFTLPTSIKDTYQSVTTISLETKEYSKLEMKVDEIEGVTYQLFLDEECLKEVKDIYGEIAKQTTDSNGLLTFEVDEGTYYVKQIDLPNDYYKDLSVQKVELKTKETTTLQFHPEWIQMKINLMDANSNDVLEGKLKIADTKVSSGETVHLKRNETYIVKDVSHPKGYFQAASKTFTIPATKEIEEVNLMAYSFHVGVNVIDIDTNQPIKNGKYVIQEGDNEIIGFEGDEYCVSNALESGKTYTLQQVSQIDGYCGNESVEFTISQESNESKTIEVTLKKIPYVHLKGKIQSESDTSKDAKMLIYGDKACTKNVEDIYGKTIQDLNSGTYEIRNGTYYVKTQVNDKKCYEIEEVKEIKLNHSSLQNTITQKINPVSANVIIQDEDGNSINSTYEILDENQKTLFSNLKEAEVKDKLERGTNYYVRLANVDGQYTYTESSIPLNIPKTYPQDTPTVKIDCTAYISLNVISDVYGGTYGLFMDEGCSKLASTIQGRKTKSSYAKNSNIEWNVRKGTYYLKEISPAKNCYSNDVIEKVILSTKKWNVEKQYASTLVSLNVSLKDEDGNVLNDGEYEIQDENGNVLDMIIGSKEELNSDYLSPSTTYVIHETKAPNGYKNNTIDVVYTLPASKPSSTPEVSIIYEAQNSVIPQLFNKSDKQEEVKKEANSIWNMNYVLVGGMLCVFIFVSKKLWDKRKSS